VAGKGLLVRGWLIEQGNRPGILFFWKHSLLFQVAQTVFIGKILGEKLPENIWQHAFISAKGEIKRQTESIRLPFCFSSG